MYSQLWRKQDGHEMMFVLVITTGISRRAGLPNVQNYWETFSRTVFFK